jgi:hypothetical protein
MTKKILLTTLVVFIVWSILDYIIHGLILQSQYQATASFWRPEAEMKMGLMYVVTLIAAFAFVEIFARFFGKKGTGQGLKFGFWFGIATGIPMGYGTYSVMPIPYSLALGWFLGSLVESLVGGYIAGAMIKE